MLAMTVFARLADELGQPIEQLQWGSMQGDAAVWHGPGQAVDQTVVVFASPGQAVLREQRAGAVA
jgi:hypothetical protein